MSLPQRILALWLPFLATDRIFRQRLGRSWRFDGARAEPVLVSTRQGNAQRVAALDEQAGRLGLRRGQGIADVRAMHPSIEIVEEDPAADRRLLEGLADWCDRYTPLVSIDGEDGLFLDITGCAHLFGGEKALMKDVLARLFHQGFEVRAGLASTPGAAWAAARFRSPAVVGPGEEKELLSPLPLSALRLAPEAIAGLESVGLRSAAAVMEAPRAPIARRFGRQVILRIDQALGAADEAISPRLPVPPLSVERRLAEPVSMTEDIERLVLLLSQALKPHLEERGEGAERLELILFRVDGAVSRIGVGSALPLREPVRLARLFHERLAALENALDAGYGFDLARLAVTATGVMAERQHDLSGAVTAEGEDAAFFADRVRARLGEAALAEPGLRQSHVPERAAGAVDAPPAASLPTGQAERPLRLLPRPDPVEIVDPASLAFRWRRVEHKVGGREGPERIEPEWWRDGEDAAARDYFRVEDEEGRRYWMYREVPAAAGVAPRWFMQGLFA